MAAESGTSLDAIFKDVYVGSEMQNRVPEEVLFQNLISFDSKNRVGDEYIIGVLLKRPYGGTRKVGSDAKTDFTLRAPTVSATAQAKVTPATYIGRGQLPYVTRWRSSDNPKGAFEEDTELVVNAHKASALFEKEIDMIYGGTHLGEVETETDTSTSTVLKITKATWAPGIWAQYEKAKFDVYDSTLTTKRNAVGDLTLDTVNPDTRELTFSADSADANDVSDIAIGDVIIPAGSLSNTMTGMVKIITNNTTLFNIAQTNLAWKGNSYDVAGPLTMGKLGNACLRGSTRTIVGNWKVVVSPYSWQDMANDSMSLRRFVEATKSEVAYGTQKLSFVGAAGSMEIMPYPLVKAGEAIAFRSEHFRRIGSTQFEFKPINESGGNPMYLHPVTDKAAYEFRYGWDEALFCDWPGANVHLTGIVNASLA